MMREGESPLTQTQRTHRARLKRHAQGICWFCVKPIAPGSSGMCVDHLTRNRARKRTTQATGAWQPGGAGRPPLWSKHDHDQDQEHAA